MSEDVSEATGLAAGSVPPESYGAQLYARVLGGEFGQAQVWFDQRVLDRYRGMEGGRVIRTNSAGRVRASGGWSLDFGISADDRLIHAPVADVAQRVPEGERGHWVQHLVVPAFNETFVLMRLFGAACMDDGELRPW
jgi:hypothetical protein